MVLLESFEVMKFVKVSLFHPTFYHLNTSLPQMDIRLNMTDCVQRRVEWVTYLSFLLIHTITGLLGTELRRPSWQQRSLCAHHLL